MTNTKRQAERGAALLIDMLLKRQARPAEAGDAAEAMRRIAEAVRAAA